MTETVSAASDTFTEYDSLQIITTVSLVTRTSSTFTVTLCPSSDIDTSVDSKPINWLSESIRRVGKLSVLESGWDGEGSSPISHDLMDMAVQLLIGLAERADQTYLRLPPPHVSPVPGGTLQLEWRTRDRYLELEFTGANSVRATGRIGRSVRSLGTISLDGRRVRRLLDFVS